MTFHELLSSRHLDACVPGRNWAEQFSTFEEAWIACHDSEWMLWLLEEVGWDDETTIRLYALRCLREARLDEQTTAWDALVGAKRCAFIVAAEDLVRNGAKQDEWDTAWLIAWDAACAVIGSAALVGAWLRGQSSGTQADILREMIPVRLVSELVERKINEREALAVL